MNKNILVLLALIIVLGGGAWFVLSQSTRAPGSTLYGTPATTPTDQMENKMVINLLEQDASGQSGTATLTETNGQVMVSVRMTGFEANVSQPAHIHIGACPDVGAVKYPLTNVLNGQSETTLDVTLTQLQSELPLGLNIHKSAAQASVYTSCGNLAY